MNNRASMNGVQYMKQIAEKASKERAEKAKLQETMKNVPASTIKLYEDLNYGSKADCAKFAAEYYIANGHYPDDLMGKLERLKKEKASIKAKFLVYEMELKNIREKIKKTKSQIKDKL